MTHGGGEERCDRVKTPSSETYQLLEVWHRQQVIVVGRAGLVNVSAFQNRLLSFVLAKLDSHFCSASSHLLESRNNVNQ